MKRLLQGAVILVSTCLAASTAQAALSNADFETGVNNEPPPSWTVKSFLNPGITLPVRSLADLNLQVAINGHAAPAALTVTARTNAGSRSQTDPLLGSGASFRWPLLGQGAAVINQSGKNQNVNVLEQTGTMTVADVDPHDGLIHVRFAIAPVLENPAHLPTQQPYTFVDITNLTTGKPLYRMFYGPDTAPNYWKTLNVGGTSYGYLNWEPIDIAPGTPALNLGDQIKVTIVAAGCSLGSHVGEVYVDSSPTASGSSSLFITAKATGTVSAAGTITYSYSYGNYSANVVGAASIEIPTPAGLAFGSLSISERASCTTPPAGIAGTISCLLSDPLAAGAFKPGALTVTFKVPSTATPPLVHTDYTISAAGFPAIAGPLVQTAFQQTLAFPAQTPAQQAYANGSFQINPPAASASPNSGNPIVYSSKTPDVCTLSGTQVTIVGTGLCTIAANQPGDDSQYEPAAEVAQSVTIGNAPAITSADGVAFTVANFASFTVSSTGAPVASLALSPDDTLPNGIAFADNGDGTATLSGTAAPGTVGSHVLHLTAHNAIGADAAQTFTLSIEPAPSTLALTAAPTSTVYGQATTLTASVASANSQASGTVAFTDAGTTLPGCAAVALSAGHAQCAVASLASGAHSISATYSGDANTSGSTGPTPAAVSVAKATTVVSVASPGSIALGSPISIGATVAVALPGAGSPSGRIAISDGGTGTSDHCTIVLPATSCALVPSSAGAKTLTATYVPDTAAAVNFNSSDGTGSLTVDAAGSSIALTASRNPSTYGEAVTFTATVSAATGNPTPGGHLAFSASGVPIDGCSAAILNNGEAICTTATLAVGANTIAAAYSGDTNNLMSQGSLTQTVEKAATTLSIVPASASIRAGSSVSVSANLAVMRPGTGVPTGTIGISDGGDASTDRCTIALPAVSCILTPSRSGSLTLTAADAGDANVSASGANAALAVTLSTTRLTLTSSPNPSMLGQAVTFTVTASTVAPSEAPTAKAASASAANTNGPTPQASSPPTGSVTFSDNGTILAMIALSNGVASYSTTALGQGNHSITANYSGDGNSAAASISQTQQVSAAPAPTVAAPALNRWTMGLLGCLIGVGAYRTRRRRNARG
ncbi:MAG: Ig-like domain repeat protein [Rudaea sp.]|nr:Ig-like domain repeat protein [Rudaea sp.]